MNSTYLNVCDFETSYFCGYEQDKSDDFDWIRHSGETESEKTGPTVDHTHASNGL